MNAELGLSRFAAALFHVFSEGLFHHKFPRHIPNGDEIHALRQTRYINLLGFSGDGTRHQGLAHEIGDSE